MAKDAWIENVFKSMQLNLSYPHLSMYLSLIPHDDKPILITYLPNSFEKIQ